VSLTEGQGTVGVWAQPAESILENDDAAHGVKWRPVNGFSCQAMKKMSRRIEKSINLEVERPAIGAAEPARAANTLSSSIAL